MLARSRAEADRAACPARSRRETTRRSRGPPIPASPRRGRVFPVDREKSPRIVPGAAVRPSVAPVSVRTTANRLVPLGHQRHQRSRGDELAQRRVEVASRCPRSAGRPAPLDLAQLHRDQQRPLCSSRDSTCPTRPRRTASGLIRTACARHNGPGVVGVLKAPASLPPLVVIKQPCPPPARDQAIRVRPLLVIKQSVYPPAALHDREDQLDLRME